MWRAITTFLLCLMLLLLPLLAWTPGVVAQEKSDARINAAIRKEETDHSQIMRTLHFLTDVYGPRLTGTPNLKAADEWAVRQLQGWGLENAHLEPWDFGSPGWTNESLSARIVSPVRASLACAAVAWTPGTNGTVTAQAYRMDLPAETTQEDLDRSFAEARDKIKGRIVLTGKYQLLPVALNPPERRMSGEEVKELLRPREPRANDAVSGNSRSRRRAPLSRQQANEQIDRFLIENGALLRINDSGDAHGIIRAFTNTVRDLSRHPPMVVMRHEDYGRISRLLADGATVTLEFNIVNRMYPEGRTAYNVIVELPGTDKRDEIVMLGAHLDSHHLATGATDNAIGCAVMMEAVRILKAIGAAPRRTVRLALWSGEEQKALGSQAYVRRTFGTFENPAPDFSKFDAYFNLDGGTGRIRAVRVFGPPAAAQVLSQILAPLGDLGVVGAGTYSNRTYGGSDHSSFSMNGLPAVYIDQDPIEYGDFTWHTNLDTYDEVIESDAKQCAIVIAATVYQLSIRDELLPRFGKGEMPPPEAPAPPAPAK